MAKICPQCQRQYVDEATFCSECGVALTAVAEAAPQAQQTYAQPDYQQQTYAQADYQQQAYAQPQTYATPAYQYAPVENTYSGNQDLYPAVSTGTYFWLNIAMAIPFVGFILSIILTCAPKNRSLKNYARAYLIANLIVIGLAVVGIIISIAITGSAFAMFSGGSSGYNYFY